MEIQIKNFITAVAGIAMKKLHIFVKKRIVQEVTIRYNNPKTLEVLKGLAKYFDFVISRPKKNSGTKRNLYHKWRYDTQRKGRSEQCGNE
ncbi:MAG: hypothetical protein H7257_14675 [Taibaiella sp.]|nr:hypothetical protein [Taibaiella sp.]